ncbi:MAG: hypothetical protein ACR2GC_08850 [Methyloceanibacter sp.]|uniref:hypothetical protein n=1 Tax=Methyloceanibacter sp. TaxID=1965321 RepID=UPI003D9B3121
MRFSISKTCVALAVLCTTSGVGFAAEKNYICTINEVYECVAVTGCSRLSLEDANLAGIMLLDVEKKQLTSIAMGKDPRTDDLGNVTVTDKTILINGTRGTDGIWSSVVNLETGQVSAGVSTPDSTLSLLGKCTPKP